jgi:hypothetical protein
LQGLALQLLHKDDSNNATPFNPFGDDRIIVNKDSAQSHMLRNNSISHMWFSEARFGGRVDGTTARHRCCSHCVLEINNERNLSNERKTLSTASHHR